MIKKDPGELKFLKEFSEAVCPDCNSRKVLTFVNNPGKYICKECDCNFEDKKKDEI